MQTVCSKSLNSNRLASHFWVSGCRVYLSDSISHLLQFLQYRYCMELQDTTRRNTRATCWLQLVWRSWRFPLTGTACSERLGARPNKARKCLLISTTPRFAWQMGDDHVSWQKTVFDQFPALGIPTISPIGLRILDCTGSSFSIFWWNIGINCFFPLCEKTFVEFDIDIRNKKTSDFFHSFVASLAGKVTS